MLTLDQIVKQEIKNRKQKEVYIWVGNEIIGVYPTLKDCVIWAGYKLLECKAIKIAIPNDNDLNIQIYDEDFKDKFKI